MYERLVRPLLFALDPEDAHNAMKAVARAANSSAGLSILQWLYKVADPRLEVQIAGLSFKSPVGLAAGLDKNVDLVGLCAGLGFGHVEVGTVTAQAQAGNPRPRIFRLRAEEALINRMGFPSAGADVVREALVAIRHRLQNLPPIGVNIGKSRSVAIEEAVADYCYSFVRLAPIADYVAINVSSPNTPGLRELQERTRLTELLQNLQQINVSRKPLFVKVAPDLDFAALEEIVEVCSQNGVAGIIATNTTISRDGVQSPIDEIGGLSGAPLFQKSLKVVRFLSGLVQNRMALVGVGGVGCAEDVLSMLSAGASAVQLYTSLVFKGPGLVKSIHKDLASFMDREGCSCLSEAALAWQDRQKSHKTSEN